MATLAWIMPATSASWRDRNHHGGRAGHVWHCTNWRESTRWDHELLRLLCGDHLRVLHHVHRVELSLNGPLTKQRRVKAS